MQAADRGMGIPGAAGAVFLEHVGQPRRVFGEMFERHGAVLDEGDGFALILHRHHDVEARGPHFANRALQLRIEHIDDTAPFGAAVVPGNTEIADQRVERRETARVFVVVFGEFNEKNRLGVTAQERRDGRLVHRDVAGQTQHGAVDQFDGDRLEFDDVLRRGHGLLETPEMAGADGAPSQDRRKLQLDPARKRERAFGADQQMGEIDVVAAGHERIEIVTADPALHLRKPPRDFGGITGGDSEKIANEALRHVHAGFAQAAEMGRSAVGQDGVDRQNIFAGVAVAQ